MTKKKQYLRPTTNRIMISKPEIETVSQGGILLPGNENKKNTDTFGTITMVGPDFDMKGVEVGDIALFVAYSGTTLEHNGEEVTILSPDDIIAVLSERE
jgi:co-chaperonin GroES (HSP10)